MSVHEKSGGGSRACDYIDFISAKSLHSFPSQPEDAGRYTCVATNAVGQDSHTVTLTVHTHPIFTELLGDVALNKGERLLLACGVGGIPPPTITWAFNNNIVPGIEPVDMNIIIFTEESRKWSQGHINCLIFCSKYEIN